MESLAQIVENYSIIIAIIAGAAILMLIIPIFLKHRDRKLLESVRSPNRGTKSERALVLKLLKMGIPAQTIFHDLSLEKRRVEFSQIDLVVATSEGILVFEVKDYSGWIYGNANYPHWTKVLAYGKQKYRITPLSRTKAILTA